MSVPRTSCLVLLSLLAGSQLSTGALSGAPASDPGPSRTVTCAFSNPSYSGWCRVTENLSGEAQADRVCGNVLRCLNDVDCVKTYCNATTIRRGWKLESVKTEAKKS